MEDSEWEPYLQNLPERVRGVPLASFDNSQMVALQDAALAMVIDERRVVATFSVSDVLVNVPASRYTASKSTYHRNTSHDFNPFFLDTKLRGAQVPACPQPRT